MVGLKQDEHVAESFPAFSNLHPEGYDILANFHAETSLVARSSARSRKEKHWHMEKSRREEQDEVKLSG